MRKSVIIVSWNIDEYVPLSVNTKWKLPDTILYVDNILYNLSSIERKSLKEYSLFTEEMKKKLHHSSGKVI